jgi:hypothetical protein
MVNGEECVQFYLISSLESMGRLNHDIGWQLTTKQRRKNMARTECLC